MDFHLPPSLYNCEGNVRRVGFEIEFGDLDLDMASSCIENLYGGTIVKHSKFSQEVKNTRLGNFTLAMDAEVLAEKSYDKILRRLGLKAEDIQIGAHTLDQGIEQVIESVVRWLVPYEISAPPVPITGLHEIEKLRKALYVRNATGTTSSPLYAFATHINTELPTCNTAALLRYTRAFLLLYPRLLHELDVNITRRMSPYIKPFPEEYCRLVLNPGYDPDFEQFLTDYNFHNPSRNRPLDLYPVLAYMAKDRVALLASAGKVNARPSFHFRLPNSHIDDKNWTFAKVWNTWVQVEKLAAESDRISQLSREYLNLEASTLIGFHNKWRERLEQQFTAYG